jgi:outer membrane immunogenic protein
MKRIILSSLALAAFIGSASAADLPRRAAAPVAAPVYMPVAYNWTGFYAGINGGWSFGTSSWRNGSVGSTGDFDTDGAMVGGTLGYNWQLNGPFVFGVETDLDWSDARGTTNVRCPDGCKTKNGWLGTARARVGYAYDRWMPYVTGGAAYGDIKANVVGFSGESDTNVGWTVGGGVEFALPSNWGWGNWTAKAEYLYVDLGDIDCSVGKCGGIGTTKVDYKSNVVRAGLNYRF